MAKKSKYMLIKESIYSASIKEQLEHAKTIHAIPLTEDVLRTERLYNLHDLIGKKVNAGDTLHIYSIFHIGMTYQSIMDALYTCHMNHVKLYIDDINYRDLVNSSGTPKSRNKDYDLLYGFLERFQHMRTKKSNATHNPPGRKRITWDKLSISAQGVILFHVLLPRRYSIKQAHSDLITMEEPLGLNKIQQLSNDLQERIAQKEKFAGESILSQTQLTYIMKLYFGKPSDKDSLKQSFKTIYSIFHHNSRNFKEY